MSALLAMAGLNAVAPLAYAQEEPARPICEYRLLNIDPDSGEITFVRPQKTGLEDCDDSGAAMADLDPSWRQRLPPRVRWKQLAHAATLCQTHSAEWGQRTGLLAGDICVFLQPRDSCTIVTPQAVSQAVLANAVRYCAP